ncbi:MAG: sulfurtransferase [Planctomycetota bacterium]
MPDYAHPEVLVTTDWVLENHDKPGIRLVEVDVDTQAFTAGHIPGAVAFDWTTELQDRTQRDIVSKDDFEKLLSDAGIENTDTIVLYGDNNNWFAAYAFWVFKYYGHEDVRLMNGGRIKWLAEDDKPLTTDPASVTPSSYAVSSTQPDLRSFVQDALRAAGERTDNLIDVRSPAEFSGEVIAPPGMSETAQRGGHIPGAKSVPWVTAVGPNGVFKTREELDAIYLNDAAIDPDKPTIAYCRIGERSSHTWFVLKYLLGLKDVRNYDGSWTEYGSMVGVPIEKEAPAT